MMLSHATTDTRHSLLHVDPDRRKSAILKLRDAVARYNMTFGNPPSRVHACPSDVLAITEAGIEIEAFAICTERGTFYVAGDAP